MAGYLSNALWLVLSLSFLSAASSSSSVAPIVTNISEDQTVTSPAPVSFNCTVDSYPPSNITWLHNGAEVQAAPPRVTISTVQVDNRTQESTLTLLSTTAEDIGTYTCSAVNGVGLTNRTTKLRVLGELALLQLYTRDAVEAHSCIDTDSEVSLDVHYTTDNNHCRMVRLKGVC